MRMKSRMLEGEMENGKERKGEGQRGRCSTVPAVSEGLQGYRGRHLQRLPGQVLLNQPMSVTRQRAQRLLETSIRSVSQSVNQSASYSILSIRITHTHGQTHKGTCTHTPVCNRTQLHVDLPLRESRHPAGGPEPGQSKMPLRSLWAPRTDTWRREREREEDG